MSLQNMTKVMGRALFLYVPLHCDPLAGLNFKRMPVIREFFLLPASAS